MPEHETEAVFSWTLQHDSTLVLYGFYEDQGVLQVNGEVERFTTNEAMMLGVLLRHADAPVTSEDFYEAGIQTKGGNVVKKGMRTLQNSQLIGRHILQVGENKRSVYSFITNPGEVDVLLKRMEDMHEQLYGESDSIDAQRHKELHKKLGAVGVAVASLAGAYIVLRRVHRK